MRRLCSGKVTDLLTVMAGRAGVGNPVMWTPRLGHSALQHDAHSPQQGEPGQVKNMSLLPYFLSPRPCFILFPSELTDF